MSVNEHYKRDELVGKEFKTLTCGKLIVVDYKNYMDITVMFDSPKYITKTRLDHLYKGLVKNPLYPKVQGRGYMGLGIFNSKHKAYRHWVRLLRRVYDDKDDYNIFYKGVTVCDEWLNFQNFASWCETQPFFSAEDGEGRPYQLDKDVLVRGNKVYSPDTCCFVPHKVNTLLITCKASRGEHPLGVTYSKRDKVYKAIISYNGKTHHLGQNKDVGKVFNFYKVAKEHHVKIVAGYWKGRIDDKVYQALINYEVHIDD